MKTISQLIIENRQERLKIRYADWKSIKYFSIQGICETSSAAYGFFDNGDPTSFSLDSDFWEVYYNGAECTPSAV